MVETLESRISWRQLIGIPLNVVLFLTLMVLGWGSAAGFFAHPVRVGVVILHLIMIPVMTLATSGRSRGTKHTPDWRPFFPCSSAIRCSPPTSCRTWTRATSGCCRAATCCAGRGS
jgi:hypothetical protein